MQTSLDCIPCLIRQAIDAARMVSPAASFHERVVRDVLELARGMDMRETPPLLAQKIHRMIRSLTGESDPYKEAKRRADQMALDMLPALRRRVMASKKPMEAAVKVAIAGNIIDMGAKRGVSDIEIEKTMDAAFETCVEGDIGEFTEALVKSEDIVYLADNAGEVIFDRLLVELILPKRVSLVVRGAPVINDATLEDARFAGLHEVVEILENGSDAPGTVLSDCSADFLRRLNEAELIIAKGQGNFETLSEEPLPIFFLLKVKCGVIAERTGFSVGSMVLKRQDRYNWGAE